MMNTYKALLSIGSLTVLAFLGTGCQADAVASAGAPVCESGEAQGSCSGSTSSYPSGSFGTNVGSKVENLDFLTPEGETITLQDLRAGGDKTLLLVSTTAGWCSACIEEQPFLESFFQTYSCEGLDVMVAVFEDAQYAPVNESHAGQWKTQYGLSFNVFADPEKSWSDYYDVSMAPMNMLIDLCTMEILEIHTGSDPALLETLINEYL
jgi:peroxiredoxin